MKLLLITTLIAGTFLAPHAYAISTVLNYQGTLQDAGTPATGVYDFQFQLFNTSDVPISQAIQVDDLNVVRGVFTARLDFQDSFGGADTLIKISVRPGASSAAFTSLVPATPIDPTPYSQLANFAQFAASAQAVGNGSITEPNIVTGAVSSRTIAAGAIIPAKIAALAVTNPALADGAVDSAKIANLSITSADISSGSIGNAQLAVNAVQSAEILDHSVKLVDLAGVEATPSISAMLSASTCVDQTLNVPGAALGDYPILAIGQNGLLPFKMTVTALNVPVVNGVAVRICNFGAAAANVTTLPVKILLLR